MYYRVLFKVCFLLELLKYSATSQLILLTVDCSGHCSVQKSTLQYLQYLQYTTSAAKFLDGNVVIMHLQ